MPDVKLELMKEKEKNKKSKMNEVNEQQREKIVKKYTYLIFVRLDNVLCLNSEISEFSFKHFKQTN